MRQQSLFISCLALVAFATPAIDATSSVDRALILAAKDVSLRTGAYSPFAAFQDRLVEKLVGCSKTGVAAGLASERREGLFGSNSAAALLAAHDCGFTNSTDGVLTADLWRSIAPDLPIPELQERIAVIILTFEATDFGQPPEWNLCQDGFEARNGQLPLCINHTDPCSFLTWGPRGATAGQGREIQWVLARVLRDNPALLAAAFGDEFENLRRLLTLSAPPPEDCNGETPLEHFMCALWLDKYRRGLWTDALTRLGRERPVRAAFDAIYALDAFDGYKLRAYYALWNTLGIDPSEIDYAFFLDRATQIGPPPEDIAPRVRLCMQSETSAQTRNAAARRCLSDLHRHPTQPADRLARDVAFYREGYPPGALSARETARWQNHIPISAHENFGLSDDRRVPVDEVLAKGTAIEIPQFNGTALTEAEQRCPASILKPNRTRPQSVP